MKHSLETYLQDHLAGANLVINILESLLEKQLDAALESFTASILAEILADRNVLKSLADQTGAGTSKLKEVVGWVGEKLSQAKLGGADSISFEIFEALELVELGIRGKLQLWRALQVASQKEDRLRGLNYAELIARAEAQYSAVELRRISHVLAALGA